MSKPRKTSRSKPRRAPEQKRPRARPILAEPGEPEVAGTAEGGAIHSGPGPRLTGGDVDADWQSADSVGEEAVGGSVATPDQDIVDALGEALGVPQEPDAPVRTSGEILNERDADRWRIEREAASDEDRG